RPARPRRGGPRDRPIRRAGQGLPRRAGEAVVGPRHRRAQGGQFGDPEHQRRGLKKTSPLLPLSGADRGSRAWFDSVSFCRGVSPFPPCRRRRGGLGGEVPLTLTPPSNPPPARHPPRPSTSPPSRPWPSHLSGFADLYTP